MAAREGEAGNVERWLAIADSLGDHRVDGDAEPGESASDDRAHQVVQSPNREPAEYAPHRGGDTVRELVLVEERPPARRSLHPVDPELATRRDIDRVLQGLAVPEAHRGWIEAVEPDARESRGLARGDKERFVDGHVEGAFLRLVDEKAEAQNLRSLS